MNPWFDYRRPRGGVALVSVLFMLAGAALFLVGDTWFTRYVCPFFFPLGVGLWLKHSWARWIAFSLIGLSLALGLLLCFTEAFTYKLIFKMVATASTLYVLWDWEVYPEGEALTLAPADD